MDKNNNFKILIVDDEPDITELLSDILADEGYRVSSAENATEANELYQNELFHVVLLDIWMPDEDGITLLSRWNENSLKSMIIMMSGHGTIETAVKATKLGAYDFIEKPISMAKLQITIDNAINKHVLETKNNELLNRLNPPVKIVGRTAYIKDTTALIDELVDKHLPVCFFGPAGSGKTHFARYLHQSSIKRQKSPFIAINAPTLNLDIDGEILGTKSKTGLIQQCQGGTLLVTEVAELDIEAQLLFQQMIKTGYFYNPQANRQDLLNIQLCFSSKLSVDELKDNLDESFFYEITAISVTLQGLKSYFEDIPELIKYFIYQCVEEDGLDYRDFSMQALNYLRQYDWPGNVRELKNFVQRALVLGDDKQIEVEEVEQLINIAQRSDEFEANIPIDLSLRDAREMFEKTYFLKQLEFCEGNIAKLSERTAMERTNLYRKLKSLGIQYK